jgi:hypothetical protein
VKPLHRTLQEIEDAVGHDRAIEVLRIALREAFDAGGLALLRAFELTPAASAITVGDIKAAIANLEGRP